MAKVKTIIGYGTHHSPQGPVTITPERAKHWQDSHGRMKAQGIEIPVPWAHNREAIPDSKESAFFKSKYNAGYLDSVTSLANGVEFVLDIPGVSRVEGGKLLATAELPGGVMVPTAIKEISPSIAAVFRDGKNNLWPDSITHVALTPLPVAGGQPGFTEMSTEAATGVTTATVGVHWMALDDMPGLGDESPKMTEPDGDEEDDEMDDDPLVPETPKSDLPENLLNELARAGMKLPDDTAMDTLADRLLVAVTALNHKPGGNPSATPTGPVEEQQPETMMMSLPEEARPFMMKIIEERNALKLEKRQKRFRKLTRKFNDLSLPAEIKATYFSILTQQNLSLDGVDDAELDRFERDMALTESVLKVAGPEHMKRLTKAKESPNPLEPGQGMSKHADDVVAMASGQPRNGSKK